MKTKQLKGVLSTFKIKQADNTVEALKELQENSIGFIAVSSPCSISFPSKIAEKEPISEEHLRQSYRILKRGRFMALFVSHENDYEVKKLAEKTGFQIVKTIIRILQCDNVSSFENCIILRKPAIKEELNIDLNSIQDIANDIGINDTSTSNKVYINSGIGENRNTKPIALIKQLIETFLSKHKNETVLDFFHDTGVTALACIEANNGCNYLGIEQDYSTCEQSISLIREVIKHEKRQISLDIQNMRKAFEKRFTLHNGDSKEILKSYPDNYFDTIITDAPYGINMDRQKGWDKQVPSVELWQECYRVLKPGGYIAVFSSTRLYHSMASNMEAGGFEIVDMLTYIRTVGKPKGENVAAKFQDNPSMANLYKGCSTSLRPAQEPIVLARKKVEGNFANNVLAHGTGVMNFRDCSVPNHPTLDKNRTTPRVPSNIIHDGSESVLEVLGDKARFYPCAKASQIDKNNGLDPIADQHLYNLHPTVKSHELMKWLVKLLCPVPNMKVLDCFCGSGSTGKAIAALKELNLSFTGIDLDPEFCEIAEKRIVDMLNRVNNGAHFLPAEEIKEVAKKHSLKKATNSTQNTRINTEQTTTTGSMKWFGGLGRFTKQIKSLLPKRFNRYIEPLSGSGSLIFDLENKQGVINDPKREFVAFHELLQSSDRTKLVDYIERVQNERDRVNQSVLKSVSPNSLINQFKGICSNPSFGNFLKQEIGKLKPNSDHADIKTSVHQALYYSYRDSYNQKRGSFCLEHIATWFVLRELAYSQMIRFNTKGIFNVPYGKNFNGKNLISRLKNIIQRANKGVYKKVSYSHSDIEHFFNEYNNLNKSDFIFLNATEKNTLEHSKIIALPQIRSAKTMLIVESNPEIRSLYSQDFNVKELSSKYLVITNYGHQDESINATQLSSHEQKEAA